jgi:hypothetical protein
MRSIQFSCSESGDTRGGVRPSALGVWVAQQTGRCGHSTWLHSLRAPFIERGWRWQVVHLTIGGGVIAQSFPASKSPTAMKAQANAIAQAARKARIGTAQVRAMARI